MGPFLSAVHLLLALVVPVSVGLCLCASRVASFSGCCGAPLFRCCCLVFCCGCCLFVVCPCGFGACGLARSLLFPPLPSPLGCLLVFSGPVSVLLVPPSGYLVVSATVRLSYLLAWRVVADWLLSSLRFMATKASALCGALPSTPWCGCCSCALRSCTELFALG